MSKHLSPRQNAFKGSKLAKLLGSLSRKEMDSFHKFLSSPWFNGSAKVKSIFQKIKGHHPEFDSPRLTHRSIFKKAFPGEAFNRHKLDKYLSDICKLLQRFMAQQEFEKDENLKQGMAMRFLGQHGQYSLLEKHRREAVQKLERQPIKGAAVYGQQLELLCEQYFHPDCKKFPGAEAMLPGMMDALDREYALRKLFLACEAMNAAHFTQQKVAISLLAEVQKLAEKNFRNEHPVFEVFLNISHLFRGGGCHGLFRQTKRLAMKYFGQMEYRERTAAISFLVNHAIRAHRKTNSKWWLGQLYALYRFGLGRGLFAERERMKESTFSNINNTAVLLRDFAFAKQFIQTHKCFLDEKIREETLALAEAFLWFHKGQTEKGYQRLRNIQFVSLRHKLVARPLISRCLYAMQLEDKTYSSSFYSDLSAFRKFVQTNKTLNTEHKKPYLNFVTIFRKIAKCPQHGERKKKISNKLRIELENGLPVVAKNWLINEVAHIGKKRGTGNGTCPPDRTVN